MWNAEFVKKSLNKNTLIKGTVLLCVATSLKDEQRESTKPLKKELSQKNSGLRASDERKMSINIDKNLKLVNLQSNGQKDGKIYTLNIKRCPIKYTDTEGGTIMQESLTDKRGLTNLKSLTDAVQSVVLMSELRLTTLSHSV